MGYWVKRLANGKEIRADDADVDKGLASWSKTENYLIGAELSRGYLLRIDGSGEYWQSDTYEVSQSSPSPILIKTRLEKKVEAKDHIYGLLLSQWGMRLRIGTVNPGTSWTIKPLPPGSANKWIILEYDLVAKSARVYFSSEKI